MADHPLHKLDGTLPKILGTATLNEKGQVVIPAAARQAMDLSAGSKVIMMKSTEKQALIILKAEDVEAVLKHFTDALNSPE